jgi:hypothetical protein
MADQPGYRETRNRQRKKKNLAITAQKRGKIQEYAK